MVTHLLYLCVQCEYATINDILEILIYYYYIIDNIIGYIL